MKFKMNGQKWEIKEVPEKVMVDIYGDVGERSTLFGLTVLESQTIYLLDRQCEERKRKTLQHELIHCYIMSYISMQELNFDEELVADISANSHDQIAEIVDKYFKKVE